MRMWGLALLAVSLAHAAPLNEQIDVLESQFPAVARAYWGALFVELDSGQVAYEKNSERLFVPASNTKLFTTALAFHTLGAEYRFYTSVRAAAPPDSQGFLAGDLSLVGAGDPTLSGREFPYRQGPGGGDPFAPLSLLARQVVESGVRVVGGNIVGDDSAFVSAPYPPSWELDDINWEYGAPVSALSLHDNAFRLKIRPGYRSGAPAVISTDPPIEYYRINNHVKTVLAGDTEILLEWPPSSRDIDVWGAIRTRDARDKLLAIRDPAQHAAGVFAEMLRKLGVVIQGDVASRHLPSREAPDLKKAPSPPVPTGVELARRGSPPLYEILKVINKVSQNLHAELVLREVGRTRRYIGSREAGLEEMTAFLKEVGIREDEYQFEDGSGLSSKNLATPASVVRLLNHMYFSEERDGWLDTLPVAGADGTLSYRFRGTGAIGRVLAKTGTMTHVSALSGYGQRPDGSLIAFSIMANNYDAPDSVIRRFMDGVVELVMLE
ncbi:MAG: D-alanyl-D-alanine carboxypeptidase/D-alanyl-D-alanine-endopeptidase [Bryobacteraceae bacterium]|nr:D-alanyl-D-alanine carboxypeptidase/D-alanyl-D-alanine-endopeptidase [Bryobacteraceae bacterium]